MNWRHSSFDSTYIGQAIKGDHGCHGRGNPNIVYTYSIRSVRGSGQVAGDECSHDCIVHAEAYSVGSDKSN